MSFNIKMYANNAFQSSQFVEYASNGSLYFSAPTQYLVGGTTALIPITQSTFTVEGWIYMTSRTVGGTGALIGDMGGLTSTDNWSFGPAQNGTNDNVSFYWYDGSSSHLLYGNTTSISLSTWHHIAISVSSGTISLFLDGISQTLNVSLGTGTTLTNRGATTNQITLGSQFVGSNAFRGLATNIRIVNGTALYSSNFTPPTAPLTAVAGTQLLLDVYTPAGYLTDGSVNNISFTNNGVTFNVANPYTFPAPPFFSLMDCCLINGNGPSGLSLSQVP
jgi:hypothetical protein